jgi:hypothetical protein
MVYFRACSITYSNSEPLLFRFILPPLTQSRCPNLMPIICTSRWNLEDQYHQQTLPWSRQELSDVLEAALALDHWDSKFCFFIDGLDEYHGSASEQSELVDDLDRLASSPFVKVCVSSRPWNVFRTAYENNPKIILQDCNKADLDIYIRGKLETNPRFRRLAASDARTPSFAWEIR